MKNRHATGATAETPEQLIEHISRLMAEAEAMLAGPVPEQNSGRLADIKSRLGDARERLGELYDGARERIGDAYQKARNGVVAGAKYTDERIRENPYQAAAIALGLGVVVGVLIGRGTKR